MKNELGFHPYKLQKGHFLNEKMKKIRLARCRALLKRFTGSDFEKIVFSDESPFTVEEEFNKQNGRILTNDIHAANLAEKWRPVQIIHKVPWSGPA